MFKFLKQNTIVAKLLEELESQRTSHPDESLREFYAALLYLYTTNKTFKKFLHDITEKRTDINEKHLANLLYRAAQYILVFEKSQSQLANYNKDTWLKEYTSLINSENYFQQYQDLLEHENAQATIYQRYVGPKVFIGHVYGNKPVSVADLGCGLNLGLPGIELNFPFEVVEESFDHKPINNLLNSQVNIQKGIALDLTDPIEKKNWALACGFYPGELENLPDTAKMCDHLWSKTSVEFFKQDLLRVSELWKQNGFEPVDVVIASTVLYQLSEEDREVALTEIAQILKPGGYLVINDFVSVEDTLSWTVDWFKKDSSNYKTVVMRYEDSKFGPPLEFIKWNNGRCKKAKYGKDFETIIKEF